MDIGAAAVAVVVVVVGLVSGALAEGFIVCERARVRARRKTACFINAEENGKRDAAAHTTKQQIESRHT